MGCNAQGRKFLLALQPRNDDLARRNGVSSLDQKYPLLSELRGTLNGSLFVAGVSHRIGLTSPKEFAYALGILR